MILTIKDAAKYLGISSRTVQRLINDGNFPQPISQTDFGKDFTGTNIRKLRCWKEEDLDQFKLSLRSPGRPKIDKNCH